MISFRRFTCHAHAVKYTEMAYGMLIFYGLTAHYVSCHVERTGLADDQIEMTELR
jgi:hypothetical protein